MAQTRPKQTRRAEARLAQLWPTKGLPRATAQAGTAAGSAAGTGDSAIRALGDGERVTRLRVSDDRVGVGPGRGHLDLAGRAADRETSVGRARAAVVGLRVGVAGLDLGHHVAGVRLGRGVLTLRALAEERR